MSHTLKLRRAEERLQELHTAFFRWQASDAYTVVQHRDPETGEYEAHIRIARPIPETWAVDLGEILFNTRSALDHLAYSLSLRNDPRLTARQSRAVAFPVLSSPDAEKILKVLACVHPLARAAIELNQPYHAGERKSEHPLAVLSRLNNIDKHRALNLVCLSAPTSAIADTTDVDIEVKSFYTGVVEDKTQLMKAVIVPRYPGANADIDVKFLIDICLEDMPKGRHRTQRPTVWTVCTDVLHYIRDYVLPPLRPFL